MFFPAAAPTPDRPEHTCRRWRSGATSVTCWSKTAERWESTWHERGKHLDRRPDVHNLLEWWNDERSAWALVPRHRNQSSPLVRAAEVDPGRCRAWSDKHGFDPLDASFGRYEDEPLPGSVQGCPSGD